MVTRCDWPGSDPLMVEYHDDEWGVPVHDDRKHFEFLVLDGAQAGLSWATVLNKRARSRQVFDGFRPEIVATYDDKKIAELLADPGIIRNKLKINSAIRNARALLAVQEEFGSFDDYIWQFVDGRTLVNRWKRMDQIPASTKESDAMSKDLKQRGFNFVGTTISYAYMQAAGMVNDHVVSCFRYSELVGEGTE